MQILNPSIVESPNKAETHSLYSLDKPSKSVVSISSHKRNKHRFALGTFENSESNSVCLLDFDEESSSFHKYILSTNVQPVEQLLDFYSNEKITQLLVSFKDKSECGSFLNILKVDNDSLNNPNDYTSGNKINKKFVNIKRLSLDPHSTCDSSRFSVVTRERLYVMNNFEEELTLDCAKDSSDKYSNSFTTGKFDPHNKDVFALSTDNVFKLLDLRQDNISRLNVKSAPWHKATILDMSFNPNMPNELVTTGEDTMLLFWDLRNTSKPFDTVKFGHGHWVKRLEYNSYNDQLLLSCGAGGSFLHVKENRLETVTPKSISCNDICWSQDDPWLYCSLLSCGLRVEMVPKSLKSMLS
ncbi:hypothetical protein MACJ_003501 [Theileria orientalis]|uniref:EIPR1-like beta-propeller domain-containing protein n=1 Tax=Theileria orientalis TaxID=68886 RepID=A0A976SKE7_THEOR|nr:hypothetical protein MACJ_003501 [Theileria orientalis]